MALTPKQKKKLRFADALDEMFGKGAGKELRGFVRKVEKRKREQYRRGK